MFTLPSCLAVRANTKQLETRTAQLRQLVSQQETHGLLANIETKIVIDYSSKQQSNYSILKLPGLSPDLKLQASPWSSVSNGWDSLHLPFTASCNRNRILCLQQLRARWQHRSATTRSNWLNSPPQAWKGVRAFLWSEAGKESFHWDSSLQYYVGLNNLSHQKWADYQARGAEI